METAQVDSHTPAADDFMPIFNGDTGLLLKALPAPYNLRLQRRKFLKLISTGIDIRVSSIASYSTSRKKVSLKVT